MNEKGTQTESLSHIPLTSVDSGKICRLVGVSEARRGRRKRRGRFRRFGNQQSNHHEHHGHARRRIMKRLLDLGLTKGCSFRVVQSRGSGPVLVEVRGTRIALGHGLANQVIVEVLEDTE